MSKPKYVKPQVQLLDKILAISLGGCATGNTPGTCGLPGYGAGTCSPTGNTEGIAPVCGPGSWAAGGCSTGQNAN